MFFKSFCKKTLSTAEYKCTKFLILEKSIKKKRNFLKVKCWNYVLYAHRLVFLKKREREAGGDGDMLPQIMAPWHINYHKVKESKK